jgi:hypothetical protein
LLRQLLGTHPDTERFPSTSTAKTTVHEMEVILDDGPFRAVVTFFPIDEVREHVNECVSEAILAAYRGDSDAEVLRRLLMHVNQRFRFNYVLGNGRKGPASDDDEEDDGTLNLVDENPVEQVIDLEATNAVLSKCLAAVRYASKRHGDQLKSELGASGEKDRASSTSYSKKSSIGGYEKTTSSTASAMT